MVPNDGNRIPRRRVLKAIGASATASVLKRASALSMEPATGRAADKPRVIQTAGGNVRFPAGEIAYIVASPKSDLDRHTLAQLEAYLEATLKSKPRIVGRAEEVPARRPFILAAYTGDTSIDGISVPADSPEAFALATGVCEGRPVAAAVAGTDRGLKRAVQRLVITSHQTPEGLDIPESRSVAKPWIPERECAVCPWVPRYVRGVFVNPYADERMNIWEYGPAQTEAYVNMFDWFGFSGVQLMETCYSYGLLGSIEAFHARLKEFSTAARANGQNVSLWVWAAEFSHYNWIDPDVTYTPSNGQSAFSDPRIRKVFEKYYDSYAELAPYVDRLMGHFYDPGNLTEQSDVFNYMRLLEGKFRARNPNIKMAVDMWAANPDYFTKLVQNGFQHYLILEQPHWIEPAKREALHQEAKRLGLDIGMWGWYSTEYETDQLASLYVNCQVLREHYQGIKKTAANVYPYRYWSEMEAHHLNDIYSDYVASQLLWNPDRDPHEILRELTDGIWGGANGDKVFTALRLVEDTRSGPGWNTYWWREPQYRIGTADAADDLRRADAAVEELEGLKSDPSFVPKFPLPFPPSTFVELMLPHLRQIRAFAQFRLGLSAVQAAAKSGAGKSEVAQRMASNWKPIPEYNTWVGTFGQIERRMQEILVLQAAKDANIEVKAPEWLQTEDAHRLLEKIQNVQLGTRGEWRFKTKDVNEFWWPEDKLQDRLNRLITEGWVEKLPDDTYRLVNWDHYARQSIMK